MKRLSKKAKGRVLPQRGRQGIPKKKRKKASGKPHIPKEAQDLINKLKTTLLSFFKGLFTKENLIRSIPYDIAAYFGNRSSWLYRHARGEPFNKVMTICTHPELAFKSWLPSIKPIDLSVGVLVWIGLFGAVMYRRKHRKNYKDGQEYGSARWGTHKEIEPFIDPEFRNNIPLTATERLMCSFPSGICGQFVKPSHPKYNRNKNVMVVGGSGSGKTRYYAKPSIMQMHSSYVITDPKGTLVLELGKMLQRGAPVVDAKGRPVFVNMDDRGKKEKQGQDVSHKGKAMPQKEGIPGLKGSLKKKDGCKGRKRVYQPYRIKIFNTIDFHKSHHYNPFAYVKTEKDILKLVTVLMENTKGDGKPSDPFWEKSERLLYSAYIGYIMSYLPEEEQRFSTLIDMLDYSEVKEDDEEAVNAIDVLFDEVKETDKDSFAVRQYNKYKMAAGKTAKSILISCGARLAPFDIAELREITSYDEMELDLTGDRLTALFMIVSDTDDTFNFLAAMMYTQLFNLLCERADNVYGGHLPVHVRCILDEFATIGKIPNFERLIATIRSREISASVILQSLSQLKSIYKDNMDTICGNCDTLLFLGGKEKTTLKDLSEALGKETIDLYNTSDTRGRTPNWSVNFNRTGKELMSQDEIGIMDGGKCILQVRGVRPFFSDKYDIASHPMYKMLSDSDKKNTFDIESYVGRRFKPTGDTVISEAVNLGKIE